MPLVVVGVKVGALEQADMAIKKIIIKYFFIGFFPLIELMNYFLGYDHGFFLPF